MARFFPVMAVMALLSACEPQNSAPEDDGEPILDIDQMRSGDASVPQTQYHATATIACTVDGEAVEGGCLAGVVRGWGDDGSSLVEITRPGGLKRAIFVGPDGEPFGADSAQADGSASWDFAVSREGDMVTVELGPERYSWTDAFVTGD